MALNYEQRRGEVETYFDKTAAAKWSDLTSEVPVSGIRATVRAGRDRMRATILGWLPRDLHGARILDAGCGTGAFALEAAARGAEVVAVDLSPRLIDVAIARARSRPTGGRIDFIAGDLLDPKLGNFDYVVSMDALIHYAPEVAVGMLGDLAGRTSKGMVFTFVPRTPALAMMFAVGRCLPKSDDRAPSIHLVRHAALVDRITSSDRLSAWGCGRSERVASGFYTSQALEMVKR